MSDAGPGATILFVCHANVCRSALAEHLARQALESSTAPAGRMWRAESAGTHAHEGGRMYAPAAEVLDALGADSSGFRSARLTAGAAVRADLILTATRVQRAAVVSLAPAAVHRVFTLRQFARLASAVRATQLTTVPPGRRLAVVLDEVGRVRGELQPVPPAEDDLMDPVNGTLADVRACTSTIQQALRPILVALLGA